MCGYIADVLLGTSGGVIEAAIRDEPLFSHFSRLLDLNFSFSHTLQLIIINCGFGKLNENSEEIDRAPIKRGSTPVAGLCNRPRSLARLAKELKYKQLYYLLGLGN